MVGLQLYNIHQYSNCVHNTDSKEFVYEHIEHVLASVHKTTFSTSDVLDSLKAAKLGEAAGI